MDWYMSISPEITLGGLKHKNAHCQVLSAVTQATIEKLYETQPDVKDFLDWEGDQWRIFKTNK